MATLLDKYDILNTVPVKLKDYPDNRRAKLFDLKMTFGGLPDMISVEKIAGQNNKILVRAFFPKEQPKTRQEAKKNAKINKKA